MQRRQERSEVIDGDSRETVSPRETTVASKSIVRPVPAWHERRGASCFPP